MPTSAAAGAPVHIVGQTVGQGQTQKGDAPIELAFDRLLLPSCITRQTFVLSDAQGNYVESIVSYDPVARVVRLCAANGTALQVDSLYRLTLVPPQNAQDAAGFQAIDGAGLDPQTPNFVEFQVAQAPPYVGPDACSAPATVEAGAAEAGTADGGVGEAGAGPDAGAGSGIAGTVDFCSQVSPILAVKCSGGACHQAGTPAAGLVLTTAQGIAATAIGRVAQGSNTGTRAQPQPPGLPFNVDMPIIAAGSPGDSWLVYKLLLAFPPACSSTPDAAPCDASVPGVQNTLYPTLVPPWTILSDSERSTLASYIPGREMPFPANPAADPSTATLPLTADEMELVSTWISQGASLAGPCN